MIKKEEWMFNGAIVFALGKKGVITKVQENNIDGTDYVYYIFVRLEGEKYDRNYHPSDISQFTTNL